MKRYKVEHRMADGTTTTARAVIATDHEAALAIAEARVTGRDDVSQVGVSMAGVSVRCPMCGGVSAALDDGTALLCYNCTMDKARRADERAVYGGAEL